jgi:hypothetical protein
MRLKAKLKSVLGIVRIGIWLVLVVALSDYEIGSSEAKDVVSRTGDDGVSDREAFFNDSNGRQVNPFAGSSRKATVLVFISTDCPISNRYAPEIQRLHAQYSPRGIVFWLVYPARDESIQTIRKHTEAFRYSIEALRDPEHQLVRLAQARVTPEAAVFMPDKTLIYHGRIDDKVVAFGKERPRPTKHDLQEILEAVVSEKPLSNTSQPAIGCYISN